MKKIQTLSMYFHNSIEQRKFIFYIMLIGIVLLPMVYTIFYSVPSADDFTMANGCGRTTLLLDSIKHANERFMTWSGLWPYMFIETLINPLLLFPIESCWMGVEMVFLFLAFIASVISVINIALEKILWIYNKDHRCFFILVILFVFLNTNIYCEIFYWFVGSSYMMALTLGFVAIRLTIKLFFNKKMNRREMILLTLSGVLTCNFFQAAILPGMVYIVLWCWSSKKEHRLLWKKTIPFWCMFTSGLISVGAPGNYARHSYFDSSLNIGKACINAGRMTVMVLNHLIQQPLVIALMIFCIYIGIRYTQKVVSGKAFVLLLVLFWMTLFLNSFPIALGYGQGVDIPNRVYFLLDSTALVGMVATCIGLGMYVKERPRGKEVCNSAYFGLIIVGSVCMLLYTTVVYNRDIKELPWFQTLYNVREVKSIHDSWIECLVTIRDSEEDIVEIEMNQEDYSSPILMVPWTSDREGDYWINAGAVEYLGKKSVIVRIREE